MTEEGKHQSTDKQAAHLTADEQTIAEQMRRISASVGNEKMSTADKETLWKHIQNTSPERRTGFIRYHVITGIAASLFLGACILAYLLLHHDHKLSEMQQISAKLILNKSVDVQVVLNNHKTIAIKGQKPRLSYSVSGALKIDDQVTGQEDQNDASNYSTLLVPYGKHVSLTLTDGTKVWVNSGSKLTYPTVFTGHNREVFLEGEAYFDVTHDAEKPFKVLTSQSETEDLGTEFNVSAYADDQGVAAVLVKGSIAFTSGPKNVFSNNRKTLIPNEMITWSSAQSGPVVKKVDPLEYTSWREGYLLVNNQPLGQILKKLERYYKTQITVVDHTQLEQTFSGKLDLREDADQTIANICLTTSLKPEKQKGGFVLKNNY